CEDAGVLVEGVAFRPQIYELGVGADFLPLIYGRVLAGDGDHCEPTPIHRMSDFGDVHHGCHPQKESGAFAPRVAGQKGIPSSIARWSTFFSASFTSGGASLRSASGWPSRVCQVSTLNTGLGPLPKSLVGMMPEGSSMIGSASWCTRRM